MRTYTQRSLRFALLIPVWLSCATSALAVTEAHLIVAIEDLAREQYPQSQPQVALQDLPAFIQTAACEDLQIRARSTVLSGVVPLHVRCTLPQQWSAYIRASVHIEAPVLTVCHSLPRNHVLTDSDLCLDDKPVGQVRKLALYDPSEAKGLALKRPLSRGAVLYQQQLGAAKVMERGDTVLIEARHGQVLIQAQGKAMAAGRMGEQIKVVNLRSGRQLAAWVVGPGTVSTRPATREQPASRALAALPRQTQEKNQMSAKVLYESVDRRSETPVIAAE